MSSHSLLAISLLSLLCFTGGCQENSADPTTSEDATNQKSTSETADDRGILDQAGDLANQAANQAGDLAIQAKDSSVDGMNWVQDKVGVAANAGSQIAGDSAKWAQETFQSLKGQGLTGASNAGEWLTEDFQNMGAWKYTILTVAIDELPELEEKLNELGQARWECFHVAIGADGQQLFYFKKSKRSYMRNLPLRDLLKMVPLMGGDE